MSEAAASADRSSWFVYAINSSKLRSVWLMQLAEEKRRLTKEVAYDLLQRLRQELAYPAVVHFYTWLLRGESLLHC